ncbi:nucleotidyltransferase domain-containing protein [Candidatus Woesearchaeota archaeon]|nr:nucleotidyltransferase domain-containing protein [Candidatus Woesearchaeota archaeon]
MKTELKIIKHFITDKKAKTIREISKQIKADYRITYIAVQKLVRKKALIARTIGKSTLCEFNRWYYGVDIYLAEEERKEEIFKNSDIKQMYHEVITRIGTSFFILLLFGSYAKGKQTKNSDIDLLFITNGDHFEHKIMDILSLLPLKTHCLFFTEEEFIRMKDAKKPNVVQEAIENNILLYGVESYYLLKNS